VAMTFLAIIVKCLSNFSHKSFNWL